MSRTVLSLALCLLVSPLGAEELDLEELLLETPSAKRLRAWHDRFCQEPHPAGSDADRRMVEILGGAFEEIGVEIEHHDFYPYLPEFVSARVEVLAGGQTESLDLNETAVEGDPWVKDDGPIAWNAYSGSGDVTAPVVYVNYGTKEDFARLAELGVDPKGKIVIARYGKNYRGYKAKFAEAAGAVGLIMYTDPAVSGFGKGAMYPEGGYANPSAIQRGSIKTLAYAGDPLTPGTPATKDAKRLDPATVALPKIPVQPLGWDAASQILSRMQGAPVPKGWQGGLPFVYRLATGNADLKVRMQIEQKRSIKHCTNVLGKIEGFGTETVVIGCHYDAWTFGAGDPHAGTIVLYEMARSFAEALKAGWKPRRTILFANWAAEEYGIIGSTEWVESQAADRMVVAYVNLDMAAMGLQFRSSADPFLQDVIEAAAEMVWQPSDDPDAEASVAAAWRARGNGVANFGLLGGGSDHVAFYCHMGIPCCTLGAGGSEGVSYHSSYDNLAWYRKVVGSDYRGALMLAQVGNLLVERLAGDPIVPYAPRRLTAFLRKHLADLDARAKQVGLPPTSAELAEKIAAYDNAARLFEARLRSGRTRDAGASAQPYDEVLAEVVGALQANPPHASWYRNLLAAPDPTSGYAAWALPRVRAAIEAGDAKALEDAALDLGAALDYATERMSRR